MCRLTGAACHCQTIKLNCIAHCLHVAAAVSQQQACYISKCALSGTAAIISAIDQANTLFTNETSIWPIPAGCIDKLTTYT